MYLRFVVTFIDEDSHKPQGVFTAAYEMQDSGSRRLANVLYHDAFQVIAYPSGLDGRVTSNA